MTKPNLPPKLIAFLKLYKCYGAFLKNYKLHRFTHLSQEELFKIRPQKDIIGNAFNWGRTPEGHSFWCNLVNKWQEYLELSNYQITNNLTTEL